MTAGPPCPDFSRVHDGPGRGGDTGQLFKEFCQFLEQLEARLHGRHMAILVENVVMACHGDINYFSQRLQYNSADLGVVQRPRLWWCRVDWTKCTDRLHLPAQSRPPAPLSFAGTSSARSWSPVPRRGRVLPLRLPATRAALLRNPPARTSTAALVSGGLRPGAPLHRGIQEFAIGQLVTSRSRRTCLS